MKCIVFDLDKTLCELSEGISLKNIELLKKLEEKGNYICICSGKPTFYLCGMFRQVGLNNPILIGENGGVIQFGIDLPPHVYHLTTKKTETVYKLKQLKLELEEVFKDVLWYQPNEIALTAFPKEEKYFDIVKEYIDSKNIEDIVIYRHVDSLDIVPIDVNKYNGLSYLANLLNLTNKDFIAVGDGVNDYCMFEMAGVSVGVNVKEAFRVKKNCNSTLEMLEYVYGLIVNCEVYKN